MRLPKIKRATWEKDYYPGAKWIVVDRKYNMYFACENLWETFKKFLWLCKITLR